MKYVIIINGGLSRRRGGTIQSASEISPPLCISSLRCKLDYFTCALSRTAKNFFGN